MTDKEKKKCKYMISILGEQILDDESDKIEVLTEGNFLMKKDHCYIGYKEYDEDAPQSFYDNLIKVQDNTVTITRKGPMRSQLMLEKRQTGKLKGIIQNSKLAPPPKNSTEYPSGMFNSSLNKATASSTTG